jgi:hypothetical protein
MRHSHSLAACSIGLFVLSTAAVAADPPKADAKPETVTISLSVRPAVLPRPALRYRFQTGFLEESPGNAAPLLLKAMFEIDERRFGEDRRREIDRWLSKPLSELTKDERERMGQYGMHVSLEQAARRRHCEWSLPFADTRFVDMLLPEISRSMDLGRWIAVNARFQLAHGEIDKALDALRIGFTTARHTNASETLISALVAAAIVEAQCRQIESLVELPGAPNLYWALTDLPRPIIELGPALRIESVTPFYFFPSLKQVAAPKLERMTREEADRMLHGLIAEFADSYKYMGLEGPPTLEQKAWMNRTTATAMVMAKAAAARKEMLARGWSQKKLEALSTSQILLLHIVQTYEEVRDELFKAATLPYFQAAPSVERAMQELDRARSREALPLSSTLLPAFNTAFARMAHTQQHIDLLRCIEALRHHAARHDGRLPERLEQITEVPLPIDPVSGKPFSYKLDGNTATLEGAIAVGKRKRAYRLRLAK